MTRIVINPHIVSDPDICHGKPTFRGTRVMVWQILEMLAHGSSTKEIREGFPSLTSKHIQAALEYASSITKENFVIVNTHA
jgi:uncharacterized protein (DUF433 family)